MAVPPLYLLFEEEWKGVAPLLFLGDYVQFLWNG